LNNLLDQANGFLYDGVNIGNNTQYAIDLVEREIEQIIFRLRVFIKNDWKMLENKVRNEKIKLIPEIKEF
jgi:hypothetical protein